MVADEEDLQEAVREVDEVVEEVRRDFTQPNGAGLEILDETTNGLSSQPRWLWRSRRTRGW